MPSLRAIAATGHDIVGVVTREPSAQGRRRALVPTAVGIAAAELGLPVIEANRLAGDAAAQITALNADLGVIVAYGGLVREPLLSAPRLGWINLHFSLLPRWRGAAPVQRALIAGDDVTGATVFQLVPELDAGDSFGHFSQDVPANITAGELLGSLAEGGAELLVRVVEAIAAGTARAEPQAGDVTLAPKLSLEDGRIDWHAQASTIHNLVRGVTPEPGAFTSIDGVRLKILDTRTLPVSETDALEVLPAGRFELSAKMLLAGTGSRPLHIISVQPAGKSAMAAADWWRGRNADAGKDAE